MSRQNPVGFLWRYVPLIVDPFKRFRLAVPLALAGDIFDAIGVCRLRPVSPSGRLDVASGGGAIRPPVDDSGGGRHNGEQEPRIDKKRRQSAETETGRDQPSSTTQRERNRTDHTGSDCSGVPPRVVLFRRLIGHWNVFPECWVASS